jgi:hypothetical protein
MSVPEIKMDIALVAAVVMTAGLLFASLRLPSWHSRAILVLLTLSCGLIAAFAALSPLPLNSTPQTVAGLTGAIGFALFLTLSGQPRRATVTAAVIFCAASLFILMEANSIVTMASKKVARLTLEFFRALFG